MNLSLVPECSKCSEHKDAAPAVKVAPMLSCAPYVNCMTGSASCGGERGSSDLARLAHGGIAIAMVAFVVAVIGTVAAELHGVKVDVTVAALSASLCLSLAMLLGTFIDTVRGAYIAALPPENRVLGVVPDECGAAAKRLSALVAPLTVVCTALMRRRFDREEMPPASK